MISEERLLNVVYASHISEKASTAIDKKHTLVVKVANNATKAEIKAAIHYLFKIEVKKITTLVIKGKKKRNGKHLGRRNNFKKAYIILNKNTNLNLIGDLSQGVNYGNY